MLKVCAHCGTPPKKKDEAYGSCSACSANAEKTFPLKTDNGQFTKW